MKHKTKNTKLQNSRKASALRAWLLVLVGFTIFVPIVSAAGLVPCGPGTDKESCTTCDLYKLANNIMNFIMKDIVPAIAVILMIVGAFFLMTAGGSEERIKKGKNILTSTIIGIIIILIAWIVVDSAIKALTGNYGLMGKVWYNIECQ